MHHLTQARRIFVASMATVCVACLTSVVAYAQDAPSVPSPTTSEAAVGAVTSHVTAKNAVEVVFAIDCSDSMSHSMPAAKRVVETILKNLAKEYPASTVRVGFLRYGDAERRYVLYDLTDERELIRRRLSETHTVRVKTEYVGSFIKKAMTKCSWTPDENVERRIYIVGNESADDGPIDYRAAAYNAAQKGVTVHAVYCPLPNEEFTIEQARRVQQLRLKDPTALPDKTFLAQVGESWMAAQNTWLLMVYLGGGECYKLDPETFTLQKWTKAQVQYLVEVAIPQEFQASQEAEWNLYLHNLRQSSIKAHSDRR